MSETRIYCKARFCDRADTLANWIAENPVLLLGEHAFVTDGAAGQNQKIGDGVTAFRDLEWLAGSSSGSGTGEKTEKGGEIHNDYTANVADAMYSSTFGSSNQSGQRAFAINAVDTSLRRITLDGGDVALTAGDTCSMFLVTVDSDGIITGEVYERFGKVVSTELVDWDQSTAVTFTSLPFDTEQIISQGCYLWVPDKADAGNYNIGYTALSMGNGNKSLQDYSLAGGTNSLALATGAVAIGSYVTAKGPFSCALGEGTQTISANQAALGQYNNPSANALLSVGNGQYGQPSNALEVYVDGSATIGKTGDGENSVATKGYVDSLSGDEYELIYDQKVTLSSQAFGATVTTDNNGDPLNLKKAIFMIDFKTQGDYTGVVTLVSGSNTLAYLEEQDIKASKTNGFICRTELFGNADTGYFAQSRFNSDVLQDSSDNSFSFSGGSSSSAQRQELVSHTRLSAPISHLDFQWQGGDIIAYRVMIWGVRA